jgi:hypothetical protein
VIGQSSTYSPFYYWFCSVLIVVSAYKFTHCQSNHSSVRQVVQL